MLYLFPAGKSDWLKYDKKKSQNWLLTQSLPIRLRAELTRQKDKQCGFKNKAEAGASSEELVSPNFWAGTIKTRSHDLVTCSIA